MAVTLSLAILKFVFGVLMGSMAVISEALHSLLDFLAAGVTYYAVTQSGLPPDERHHYGHGKFEALGGFIEAILILVPFLFILYASVRMLLTGDVKIEMVGAGLIVMGISVVANSLVGLRLQVVARATDSLSLSGDALHLLTDAATSLFVFIALLAVKLTDLKMLDPISSIVISIVVMFLAARLLWRSSDELLDRASVDAQAIQKMLMERFSEFVLDVHSVRARGRGSQRHIDFHLTVCRALSVDESHSLCDEMEREVEKQFRGSDVLIHVEPCGLEGECVINDRAEIARCVQDKRGKSI